MPQHKDGLRVVKLERNLKSFFAPLSIGWDRTSQVGNIF